MILALIFVSGIQLLLIIDTSLLVIALQMQGVCNCIEQKVNKLKRKLTN